MTRVTVFDLETQRLSDDVGGWKHIDKMGLSVAVTWADGEFRHFTEAQADDLVAELQRADLVVGFNVLRFDYVVLQPYTDVALAQLPTLDLLKTLGKRASLNSIASATLQVEKSADGLQAVEWYRQGEIDKLMAYCERDVEVTRDVYEFGRRYGFVRYFDRRRRLRKARVRWS